MTNEARFLVIAAKPLRLDAFNRLRQPALGAGGGVGVQHVLGGCLIELFSRDAENRLGFFHVACRYRCTNATDVATQDRLSSAITGVAGEALAETFLRTFGIGHNVLLS